MWNFETAEDSADEHSYDMSKEIDQLHREESKEPTVRRLYTKKLNLVKLIRYGVNGNSNDIIWDPLLEENINPLEMRQVISLAPPRVANIKKFNTIINNVKIGRKVRSQSKPF